MELYCLRLAPLADEAVLEKALALLPAWRRNRALALKNPAARQASVGAGLLLTKAFLQAGIAPDAPVTLLPAGKPVLAGGECWFSLSHGGGWALCALSETPVGADVQEARRCSPSIARRFHPRERAYLSSLPESEREAGFFRLWTRKESWVKARSENRTLALDEFCVLADAEGFYFRDYALPGAFAAVCARRSDFPVFPKELCI